MGENYSFELKIETKITKKPSKMRRIGGRFLTSRPTYDIVHHAFPAPQGNSP